MANIADFVGFFELVGNGVVRARRAPLEAVRLEDPLLEVHLVPAKRHQLRDPQAMAVGKQDHRRVTVAVSAALPRHLNQVLDLGRREVVAVVLGALIVLSNVGGERYLWKPRRC
jgi:hypothetical protein